MDDWKKAAKHSRWDAIQWYELEKCQLQELENLLKNRLPNAYRGHGVEEYPGNIRPHEAKTLEDWHGALLLQDIQNKLCNVGVPPVTQAVEYAIYVLGQYGIEFDGWDETYLYGDDQTLWKQIESSTAQMIIAKLSICEDSAMENWEELPYPEKHQRALKLEKWKSLYPWRTCKKLSLLFRLDEFEKFTPLWHALNILNWNDLINNHKMEFDLYESKMSAKNPSDPDFFALNQMTSAGFEIGRSFESLYKKKFDELTLLGKKNQQGREMGAATRRFQTKPQSEKILNEMGRLINEKHHSIRRAAELVFNNGIGTSAEANRRLWTREKKLGHV
ncbi:MAG: hypothetical protein ACSHXD_07320 [Marinosulfonomonas sp.]